MPARHEKLARGLELVVSLTGTRMGRTVRELADELNCGARTMERMLAAIRQVCGDRLEMIDTDGREKRYRLRGASFLPAVRICAEEIAEMDLATRRLEAEGLGERAAALRSASQKLRAMATGGALHRSELDADALLEAEGFAARPGPRVALPPGVLAALRSAILSASVIRMRYRSVKSKTIRVHEVHPLGLLYGSRPYLVAAIPGKPEPTLLRLDRIDAVEPTDGTFERPVDFDLANFAGRSFGLWQDKPEDVVLRFTADAATEAANWCFHPTQTMHPQPDGRIVVRFRAAGRSEMCLHLFGWGEAVEVLAPHGLREMLAERAATAARHHREAPDADGSTHLPQPASTIAAAAD